MLKLKNQPNLIDWFGSVINFDWLVIGWYFKSFGFYQLMFQTVGYKPNQPIDHPYFGAHIVYCTLV